MNKKELSKKIHDLASYLIKGIITLEDFDKLVMLEVYKVTLKDLKSIK